MSTIIAIAGKGGVGKTTIASLLIRFLAQRTKGSVLAVDADPNSNLGELLGVHPEQDIGRIVDDIAKNINQVPVNMSKDQFISYRIETTLDEAQGFDVLTMGRPEGPGCYCYVNNVLRQTLNKLMASYEYIVIDNEAGFEHLSRRTVKKIDVLIVVSDSTPVGIRAAKRIHSLIEELSIKYQHMFLIVNRKHVSEEPKIDFPVEVAGYISETDSIRDAASKGAAVTLDNDKKTMHEAEQIFSKILERSQQCLKN